MKRLRHTAGKHRASVLPRLAWVQTEPKHSVRDRAHVGKVRAAAAAASAASGAAEYGCDCEGRDATATATGCRGGDSRTAASAAASAGWVGHGPPAD